MNKIFAIIILGLLLTGCSIGEKKLKVFTLEEPRAKLDIDMPTPLTTVSYTHLRAHET